MPKMPKMTKKSIQTRLPFEVLLSTYRLMSKVNERKATLNGELRTCERLQKMFLVNPPKKLKQVFSINDTDAQRRCQVLTLQKCLSKTSFVIPALGGIQGGTKRLDSRFRGNDRKSRKV
jgi:hypothetical protein